MRASSVRVCVQPSPHQQRCRQRLPECHVLACGIGHCGGSTSSSSRPDKPAPERRFGVASQLHRLAREFHNALTQFRGRCRTVDRLADVDRHASAARRSASCAAPAALHAQRMSPHAVDVNRNHGRARDAHHLSKPRWNGIMLPVRVTAPSGKMQTSSPCAISSSRVAQGAQRVPRDEWWAAESPAACWKNGRKYLLSIIRLPHQEADEARRRAADQHRIGIGDVVGDQQRAAGLGQVLRAHEADAEEQMHHATSRKKRSATSGSSQTTYDGADDGERADRQQASAPALHVQHVVQQPEHARRQRSRPAC